MQTAMPDRALQRSDSLKLHGRGQAIVGRALQARDVSQPAKMFFEPAQGVFIHFLVAVHSALKALSKP